MTIPERIERLAQHEEELWARAFETQVLLTPRPRKVNAQHARIVALGGGDYVPGMLGDLVLFNSPATGSTIALREADLTPDAVRRRIAESNAKFGVRE